MARRRGMGQRKAIRGNLTPKPGSRLTGELLPDGRPVYRIKRLVKAGVEPMKDAAGRPVMKRPHPGMPAEQRMAPVMKWHEAEYVIDDGKNGMTWMNFHFRPSPAELEAQERQRRREAAIDRLGDLAHEMDQRGINPSELLSAIRGDSENPQATAAATAEPMSKPEAKPRNGKRSDILDNAKARLNKK